MSQRTSNFYKNGFFERREKLTTLREFIQMGRLQIGQKILIGEVVSNCSQNTQTIFVGNCTRFRRFDKNEEVFGWDYNADYMDLFVLEVTEYF